MNKFEIQNEGDISDFKVDTRQKSERIEIIIDYYYDWETSSCSKLAEHLTIVDIILERWKAKIIPEDIDKSLIFRIDKDGNNSVKDYFEARNLEMPPTYYHENFMNSGYYKIQHIKLFVSVTTFNDLFINEKEEKKLDFNQFKNYLMDRLKFCRVGWYYNNEYGCKYCSGFNIKIISN